jgi:hypothetical protein
MRLALEEKQTTPTQPTNPPIRFTTTVNYYTCFPHAHPPRGLCGQLSDYRPEGDCVHGQRDRPPSCLGQPANPARTVVRHPHRHPVCDLAQIGGRNEAAIAAEGGGHQLAGSSHGLQQRVVQVVDRLRARPLARRLLELFLRADSTQSTKGCI